MTTDPLNPPSLCDPNAVTSRGGGAAVQLALPYKVYLRVPFAEKDRAKTLGARWDAQIKAWYVPPGNALKNFARWLSPDHAALKRSFEALEAAERAHEKWFALPPRDLSPREMLSLLDCRPVKRSGFCGMCDSHASNDGALKFLAFRVQSVMSATS